MTATPTRMSATDRRNQLIDVAIDLFSRKGFGGTTTKEIAAAAGVTEAIIFRHFATKQDLYKAILDARCSAPDAQAWFSEAQQFMDANDDEGLFRALIATIIQCGRDDPRFERLMLHAALEGNELAIMHHNQFALPIGNKLIAYIEKRQQEGAIRQVDPKAIIFAVAGIAHYYAHQKYLHQSANIPMSDEAVIDAFLGIIMKGLK
jgi:TetR/AcrR family transcriptional regulator